MRYAVLTTSSVILVSVAIVLSAWDRFTAALGEPAGASAVAVVVTVAPGERLVDLLPRLLNKGLIKDASRVRWYLEDFHDARPLTPGEYALSQAMSPAAMVAHLESGRRIKQPVSIPEGSTITEAAALLGQAGILEPDTFIRAAGDSALLKRLGLSEPSAEGYLQPEVYSFARGTSAEAVLDTMISAFHHSFEQSVGERTNGLTRGQVVILASLIEGAPVARKERRLFSALLRNRLRAEIPLQIAAARTYAESRAEGDRKSWDTFAHTGLPAGPICSPGTGALLAAADPATSRALHMVLRSNGTHVFCDDLDCLYEESRRHRQPLPSPLPLPRSARRKPLRAILPPTETSPARPAPPRDASQAPPPGPRPAAEPSGRRPAPPRAPDEGQRAPKSAAARDGEPAPPDSPPRAGERSAPSSSTAGDRPAPSPGADERPAPAKPSAPSDGDEPARQPDSPKGQDPSESAQSMPDVRAPASIRTVS